jgi:hypothetical protein
MSRSSPLDSYESLDTLEQKLSPSSSVGAVLAAPVVSTIQATSFDDGSLPNAQALNIPVTGYLPLIEYPPLPTSGPPGPGS